MKRNEKLDFLKGIAIFLVVWGHSIQYLNNGEFDFFNNYLFQIIYSFHMPLFMMISGYFFKSSLNKNISSVIKKKFNQLILPSILWLCSIQLLFTQSIDLKFFLSTVIVGFWFLSALFYLSIISSVVEKTCNNKLVVYFTIFVGILFLPDSYGLGTIKFMYPYFVIGLFIGKSDLDLDNINWPIAIICAFLWVVLLLSWDKKYFLYTSGVAYFDKSFLQQTIINSIRYLAGFFGSVSVYFMVTFAFKYIKKRKLIVQLGSFSFGIYIIQTFVFRGVNKLYKPSFLIDNIHVYNFVFSPLFAMIVVVTCIILIVQIQKSKLLNKLLLGGR